MKTQKQQPEEVELVLDRKAEEIDWTSEGDTPIQKVNKVLGTDLDQYSDLRIRHLKKLSELMGVPAEEKERKKDIYAQIVSHIPFIEPSDFSLDNRYNRNEPRLPKSSAFWKMLWKIEQRHGGELPENTLEQEEDRKIDESERFFREDFKQLAEDRKNCMEKLKELTDIEKQRVPDLGIEELEEICVALDLSPSGTHQEMLRRILHRIDSVDIADFTVTSKGYLRLKKDAVVKINREIQSNRESSNDE